MRSVMTNVHVFVEELDDGTYEVVTRRDNKPWLRHGPFEVLDYANMICREMLKRAEALRDRLTPPPITEKQIKSIMVAAEHGADPLLL